MNTAIVEDQQWNLPEYSDLNKQDYLKFLENAYQLMGKYPQYFSGNEGIEDLELAHLLPQVPETVLAIYIGINDAVCNKGLVTPFLPRHSHNNVFVFEPQVFAGEKNVPAGTIDAKKVVNGFAPPNPSWNTEWTYVMINHEDRSYESLWKEKGYIDMIPAKFEDFTMLSDTSDSKVCIFIDPEAFNHPVNRSRAYLQKAIQKGEKYESQFTIPDGLSGETEDLIPVILEKGEKLFVARADFQPCDHCWSNLHADNKEWAVVNENSAVPLNLVVSKPPVPEPYRGQLIPPAGSADSTTDWFLRGTSLLRTPIKQGHING